MSVVNFLRECQKADMYQNLGIKLLDYREAITAVAV